MSTQPAAASAHRVEDTSRGEPASDPRPAILCVDDDPTALALCEARLRGFFEVTIASSGPDALQHVLERRDSGGFAVIVSDLRMPGMNGTELLGRVRWLSPDTVRVLLTAYADIESAVSAVNTGQVFRLLIKPCASEWFMSAVRDSLQQHRLLTSQRVLLEDTLHGAVTALTETLAIAAPDAFGRGGRVGRRAAQLAQHMGLENTWQVETAAHLSQVGWVALPEATANRLARGMPLTAKDEHELNRLPLIAERLLQPIPRLDQLRETLKLQAGTDSLTTDSGETAIAAACLRLAVDFDILESRGLGAAEAIDTLRQRARRYLPEMVEILAQLLGHDNEGCDLKRIPLAQLREGMILGEDVFTTAGALLIARGHLVTPALLRRLQAIKEGAIREPLAVRAPAQSECVNQN